MKKIKAIVTDSTKENAWSEEYEIADDLDCESYMNNMISKFNSSLRPNERPRTLISVNVIDKNGVQQHEYEKTNLVTILGRNGSYDTYKCKICGVTGRRYGIGSTIKRDRKYQAKCYENCTTTLKHLNR